MTSAIMFLMAAFVFANKLVDTRFSFLLRMDRDINDQHQCNQREKSIGEFHCAPPEPLGRSCVAITKFSKSYDMARFLRVRRDNLTAQYESRLPNHVSILKSCPDRRNLTPSAVKIGFSAISFRVPRVALGKIDVNAIHGTVLIHQSDGW